MFELIGVFASEPKLFREGVYGQPADIFFASLCFCDGWGRIRRMDEMDGVGPT